MEIMNAPVWYMVALRYFKYQERVAAKKKQKEDDIKAKAKKQSFNKHKYTSRQLLEMDIARENGHDIPGFEGLTRDEADDLNEQMMEEGLI
jgi:hypothetical protein